MKLNVRAILSTPWVPFEPEKCLLGSKDWTVDCAPSRSRVFRPDLTRAAAEMLKINKLDFSDLFCDSEVCPPIIGGILVCRDTHHMTATFARTLSQTVEERLVLRQDKASVD